MYHTLLPIALQMDLKAAAETKLPAAIDLAIERVKDLAPKKFHTEESRTSRVFFHEPTHACPMTNFVTPWAVTNPNRQRFD